MATRIVIARVVNPAGLPAVGAAVTVAHSSGRVIYDGQTDSLGGIVSQETYDINEGGYVFIRVRFPGAIAAVARMISQTIVASSITGSYQFMTIYPMPARGFGNA